MDEHAGEDMDWAAHTEHIRAQLEHAQRCFKKQADRNRKEHQFHVDEQVLLKLQPYTQHSVDSRPCAKLAFKIFGPYTLVENGPIVPVRKGLLSRFLNRD